MIRRLLFLLIGLMPGVSVAGGTISTTALPPAKTGINAALLSGSPLSLEIDTNGRNHVVWTGELPTPDTLGELQMTCEIRVHADAPWTPLPACDEGVWPDTTCKQRVFKWPTSAGSTWTFYVPLSAWRHRCTFGGTTPGTATATAYVYGANL